MSSQQTEEEQKEQFRDLVKQNRAKQKNSNGRQFTRAQNEETNPCVRESMMSFKCLDDNGYVRDKCDKYFKNYRNCREFWSAIVRERKLAGIKPFLPSVEERDEIRKARLGFPV
ncbi:coiled-coil-helix-coiled-coil-helix domain-containing protein 7-like [Argonauta hians]